MFLTKIFMIKKLTPKITCLKSNGKTINGKNINTKNIENKNINGKNSNTKNIQNKNVFAKNINAKNMRRKMKTSNCQGSVGGGQKFRFSVWSS